MFSSNPTVYSNGLVVYFLINILPTAGAEDPLGRVDVFARRSEELWSRSDFRISTKGCRTNRTELERTSLKGKGFKMSKRTSSNECRTIREACKTCGTSNGRLKESCTEDMYNIVGRAREKGEEKRQN